MTCSPESGQRASTTSKGTFSFERAKEAQRRLGAKVERKPLPTFPPRTIAGVDAHYRGPIGFWAIALLDYATLSLLKLIAMPSRVSVDYVPGFLAFREAPLAFLALRSCDRPDVLLVNGHGISHPRGCGLATHIGVVEGLPTIGVALNPPAGAQPNTWIEFESGSGRLYMSVGNLITQGEAEEITRHLLVPGAQLPLPLYFAHQTAQLATRWTR
jgi:deoxyribonuclease V